MGKGQVGGIIVAILGGLTLIMFVIAFPNLEVSMYFTEGSLYSQSNVEISISEEGKRFSRFDDVCFIVNNISQPIGTFEIPASNFGVSFSTDTLCENCDSLKKYEPLSAQESVNVCYKIMIPQGQTMIEFEITASYDAFLLSPSKSTTYICEKRDESGSKSNFICNRN